MLRWKYRTYTEYVLPRVRNRWTHPAKRLQSYCVVRKNVNNHYELGISMSRVCDFVSKLIIQLLRPTCRLIIVKVTAPMWYKYTNSYYFLTVCPNGRRSGQHNNNDIILNNMPDSTKVQRV